MSLHFPGSPSALWLGHFRHFGMYFHSSLLLPNRAFHPTANTQTSSPYENVSNQNVIIALWKASPFDQIFYNAMHSKPYYKQYFALLWCFVWIFSDSAGKVIIGNFQVSTTRIAPPAPECLISIIKFIFLVTVAF